MSHSGRHHRSVLNVVVDGPVGMLVLSGISLGLATALSKITLEQLTPVDLFGVEVLVSAVPLVALAWIRGARPSRPDPRLLVLGVLEPGLAYLLFDLGVQRTAASHAALLVALDAPITLALAVMFLRERVDLPLVWSLALGVGGSVLVSWGGQGAETSLVGDLLVVAATVAAAAFTVLARHVAPAHDPVVLTALQMIGAMTIAVPVFAASLGLGHSLSPPPTAGTSFSLSRWGSWAGSSRSSCSTARSV